MRNYLNIVDSRIGLYLAICVGILLLILNIFKGNSVLVDPFHHGEYFASAVSLSSSIGMTFQPLTIHGSLDYLPSIFSEFVWGSENYFLPTYAVYKFLSLIATGLLLVIVYDLTKFQTNQILLLVAATLAAPFLVSYRDLFLILSFYFFLKTINTNSNGKPCNLLLIFFGTTLAFGMFWSFDRGIAGAISLGSAIFLMMFRNPRYAISLISFAASIFILSVSFKAFAIESYINNIVILIQNSGEWNYGWNSNTILLSSFAVLLNLLTVFILCFCATRSKNFTTQISVAVAIGFLSIFMLKIGINRADLFHVYMSCWFPMLAAFFAYSKLDYIPIEIAVLAVAVFIFSVVLAIYFKSPALSIPPGIFAFVTIKLHSDKFKNFALTAFGILVFGITALLLFVSFNNFNLGDFEWIKLLSSPPSNRMSSIDGVVWSADRLQDYSVDCVFDLSNNGMINALVRRPSCSRFTYPIYASSQHEQLLISDLKSTMPRAVVYSSNYWSYSIDGKDMKIRFPKLDEFILQYYTNEICAYGYCIRYKGR